MMRRFKAAQSVSGWTAVYKQIVDQFGESVANGLFDRAEKIYAEYAHEYGGCKGMKRIHVMAAIACGSLYLPLKEMVGPETAVQMIAEAERPISVRKHNKIEKLPVKMFMTTAYLITSIMFGEKAGFQRKWHSNTKSELRYDLLTCPYLEILKSMGCPEVCPAICVQDDLSFTDLKNGVIFTRKQTLGQGGDSCDFCFRIPEKSEIRGGKCHENRDRL